MSEKIQKVLARANIASRREIERWIQAQRIQVNGKIATLGMRVTATDYIRVDGRTVIYPQKSYTRVVMYHKPRGELCTRKDPEGRRTVFDGLQRLPKDRWVLVGRLDINTSGLLLLTNDGAMANRLMHPAYECEREYAVRVLGNIDQSTGDRLKKGVMLEDGLARFETLKKTGGQGMNQWYQVVVKEGRNRLVRRLFATQGLKVNRLVRVRFGCIKLPRDLDPGHWRWLDSALGLALEKSINVR